MGNSGPRVFTWGAFPSAFPWAEIDAHLRKNRLKRLKIKQGTTSKVNCILLNKSGLVRAKAGNFNPKSLNRCFSNYYQVRTWRVFAESVTYMIVILDVSVQVIRFW